MTAFKFIDYDPRVHYDRDPELLSEFARALRRRPGKWAEFPVTGKTPKAVKMLAYRIQNDLIGCPKALRGNQFEAAFRDGVAYVRYVRQPRKEVATK